MDRKEKRERSAHDYYENYAEYNRTLRAWFVIFGVGGPATFIVNRDLTARLAGSGSFTCVAILFLIGAGAQVLIAFINKMASWCAYYGEADRRFARGRLYRLMMRVNNQFWLDVVMDLASIVTFALAITRLFAVFGSA